MFLNRSYLSLYVQLEDLQQFASNPSSLLTEILGMVSAKAKEMEKKVSSAAVSSSQMASNGKGNFDSPTVSTACASGPAEVTHLGVVGRGVKRVNPAQPQQYLAQGRNLLWSLLQISKDETAAIMELEFFNKRGSCRI
ncbi:hypothetical protein SAY86_025960 [Trapa natans]|uniref:Uncharacterized protein n=1 Tax=Trapa natans TaxID=22666 RepID=A0AAN7QH30_TRANT|nr:hypothetical protein SAY86_025960 [Trapa natans]